MSNVPANGQTVRFSKVPAGSYASPGVNYVVSRQGRTVHVRDTDSDTGTSDQTWAYERAQWEAV